MYICHEVLFDSDRSADSEHADLHIGFVWEAGAGGCSWGVVHRRGGSSAGILEAAGVDGGAVFAGSVRNGSGRADVPDGGCGEMACGWEHRVSGAERRTGKDTRIPDRVRRDRSGAG